MQTHEPQNWTHSGKQQLLLAPFCSFFCGTGIKNSNLQALIVSGCFKENSHDLKNSIDFSNIKAISYKTMVCFSTPSGACMPEK